MPSTFLLGRITSGDKSPSPPGGPAKAALTALVPGEVIAAASSVAGYLTATTDGQVDWAHRDLARALMVVLAVVVIPSTYLLGSERPGRPTPRTLGLVAISFIAFAGWLALQTPTIYDGLWGIDGGVGDAGSRAAVLVIAVLVLGPPAAALGWKGTPPGS